MKPTPMTRAEAAFACFECHRKMLYGKPFGFAIYGAAYDALKKDVCKECRDAFDEKLAARDAACVERLAAAAAEYHSER